ncbi:MAG: tail fiber protein [Azospirillaceae bacterium]|nr:tail fiber protein [Azospirillaceae bacterium]
MGEIRMVSFNFAPTGWLAANGKAMPISQYQALYSLYGTTFGGDGHTTFLLPDLQGRTPLGADPADPNHVQGFHGGEEQVSLAPNQMPLHTHPLLGNSNPAGVVAGVNHFLATINQTPASPAANLYGLSTATEVQAGMMTLNTTGVAPSSDKTVVGGSFAHENMQPFLTVGFLVAITGVYPARP